MSVKITPGYYHTDIGSTNIRILAIYYSTKDYFVCKLELIDCASGFPLEEKPKQYRIYYENITHWKKGVRPCA